MHEESLPPSGAASERAFSLAVDADGLVKLFGATPALLRVGLSVPSGSVCALLGGNGAGKTTLLRILATALRPTAGDARVCGFDIRAEGRNVRAAVDYLPASGGFYPELSALENLRFATAMRGLVLDELDVEAALARVGLGKVAQDPVRSFSSGMLRRLTLARLVLTRPRLALVDEPYAGLDESGRDLVDAILAEACREGRAAVVATHELPRVTALADQVCRLERGIVVESGVACSEDERLA